MTPTMQMARKALIPPTPRHGPRKKATRVFAEIQGGSRNAGCFLVAHLKRGGETKAPGLDITPTMLAPADEGHPGNRPFRIWAKRFSRFTAGPDAKSALGHKRTLRAPSRTS